jgi:uncharacterized protein HemY
MGKALDRRGEWEAAAEALTKAATINPNASAYYYVLGGVFRKLGKTKESQDAIETFRKLERQSSELEKKRRAAPAQ